MAIVVLRLADVKRESGERPQRCPRCEGQTFQRWGQVSKPIKDTKLRSVRVYRYRCCHCRHTFRHYPEGVSPADQGERLKQLAALCWVLGLSYRSASLILSGWEVCLAAMMIWRNVQAQARQPRKQNQKKRVSAYVRAWGGIQPVLPKDIGTMWSGSIWATGRWWPWDP